MHKLSDVSRLITFRVGGALYAADIANVERVLRHETSRPVPDMPSWMEGVLEYQGRILPVIDLRVRFGAGHHEATGGRRLLVVSLGTEWVAAAVDQVLDVRAVTAADIAPPPAIVLGFEGEFLRGVVRRGNDLVLVLDFHRILSSSDRVSLATVTSAEQVGTGVDASGAAECAVHG